MGSVTFIGLGLNDEKSITLEGLEEARRAETAFAEFYTNLMPNLDLRQLEQLIGKKIRVLTRTQMEDEAGRDLIGAARKDRVAFLVPGDPMVATTHISLRLELQKSGIESRIVHAPSIVSAICGSTGLQSYKFGKTVTVPYDQPLPSSVLDTISENHHRGLHTLLLLDCMADEKRQLTIPEAIERILIAEADLENRLAVGVARVGAKDEKVKASRMRLLMEENFGTIPHSLVAVGKLHFMETEALKVLDGAPESDLDEKN